MVSVTYMFSIRIDECKRQDQFVTITAKDLPPSPQHAIMFQVPLAAAYQFYPGQNLNITIEGGTE